MSFAQDVRTGLTASPKFLNAKYFYDELGSSLFEAITKLPEYYLTRSEAEILSAHADDIIGEVGSPLDLIELGSGSASKTRYLIDAAFRHQPKLAYRPIDISPWAVDESSTALKRAYPNIAIDPYVADYISGLKRLHRDNGLRALVLFLGSNIGNFEPPEADETLRAIAQGMRTHDAFLLGADLKKERAVLEAAYDDPLGVTAAFNKNVLARINRELGGHFDLQTFEHRARYDEAQGRVNMYLVSRVAQRVRIDALDTEIAFASGEPIHTESSYKYAADDIETLAKRSGLRVVRRWTDAAGNFSSTLLMRRNGAV